MTTPTVWNDGASRHARWVAALAGGALYPLAFAPFDFSFLAILSLALLFASWQGIARHRAALLGYVFGLAQYGVGVSWVYVSMHDYGGATPLQAIALTSLFVAFMALYSALAGWLAVSLPAVSVGLGMSLIFPSVWVLVEWFRGWFLTGFPWLTLGYSQIDTWLSELAPLGGVLLVSWATAVAGGLVAAALFYPRARRPALAALLAGTGALMLLNRLVEWTAPQGEPVSVALLQGNIPQDQKWESGYQEATLLAYAGMTAESGDAKLVIWPETAVPAFFHEVETPFLKKLDALAKERGQTLLIGVPFYDADSLRYYNALVAFGEAQGRYFKRHLVPFGEYLPIRSVLGFVLDILHIPLSDFSAGASDQALFAMGDHKLAATICYEDIFGHEFRADAGSASILVNVTNDAWFGDSIAAPQHMQMARMRALEAGRFMLRATNTGITGVINQKGVVTASIPQFVRARLSSTVAGRTGLTPFVLLGDWLALGLVAAVLLGLTATVKMTGR